VEGENGGCELYCDAGGGGGATERERRKSVEICALRGQGGLVLNKKEGAEPHARQGEDE